LAAPIVRKFELQISVSGVNKVKRLHKLLRQNPPTVKNAAGRCDGKDYRRQRRPKDTKVLFKKKV
jgi:hypothetical protein